MITISSKKEIERERERIVEQVIYWFNLFVDFHNEMTFEKMVK